MLGLVLLWAVADRGQAATLAWDPSSGATGYKLYSGSSSKTYTNVTDVGNVTSNVVAGLVLGRTYFFAVTAYDSGGESDFSNEISYTPVTPFWSQSVYRRSWHSPLTDFVIGL